MSSTCKPAISTSITLNQTMPMRFFASFRTLYSLDYTSVKTLTKIIFDLLQWQEIATLSLPKKAAIASFIWTTFRGHFRLGANDITRNRSRVIFCRAGVDIFCRWNCVVACAPLHHVIHDRKNVTSSFFGQAVFPLSITCAGRRLDNLGRSLLPVFSLPSRSHCLQGSKFSYLFKQNSRDKRY